MPKVIITGYAYTRQNLFDVFESYPDKQDLFFILPGNWTAKNGTVRFPPFRRQGFFIRNSPAYFTHSQYPLIGGLMKGWMPWLPLWLLWLRLTKGTQVLYTAGEPNVIPTLINALSAKLLGMRHIFFYWENIPYEAKDRGAKLRLKKLLIRATLALSDGAVCGMTKAADILRSFHRPIQIGVFPHAGLDEETFHPDLASALREQFGWQDKTVFLFVGALGYRKGIHLAIRALAELSRDRDDLAMLIVGSGEYGDQLKQLAAELGVSSRIRWIPWMENAQLPEVYCSADVFLYPSIPDRGWEEQLGYSIGEASLCELPVISTRSGSIDEILVDGQTGILVPPGDQEVLTAAMRQLADQPELRHRLGAAGRQFIIGKYSNHIIAQKLHGLFQAVL